MTSSFHTQNELTCRVRVALKYLNFGNCVIPFYNLIRFIFERNKHDSFVTHSLLVQIIV